jgi:hypothetical protein
MKIENSNKYGRLEEKKLIEFEKKIEGVFPEAFRSFILEHNGGKPVPSSFKLSEKQGTDRIHHMYGLHNGPSYCRIDNNWKVYKNRMPKSLVPIADDPFGNAICIGINGNDKGKVFFWDHENEGNKREQPFYGNVQIIAENFQTFLNELFEWVDPNESQIDKIMRTNNVEELKKLLDSGYEFERPNEYNCTLIEVATIKANSEMIIELHKRGAKERDSLNIANNNAEFFEKHKAIVTLLKRLYGKE